ncbi:DUF3175 domain-containing protein [Sinorhizobium fredii]|uniref:DUF3175 domain-containing protein n=1 Tax=Rhizobium fredii TaxID=380 RepID=UPI0004B5C022|nr:DUF3175 domain-containing protein [Sinorhizobium fredii]AWI61094.1 hypothetical protein AB395_00005917 [Sinorhizobium fredii CCBAU 45436]
MGKRSKKTTKWSQEVTAHSNALDIEPGVFASGDPHRIAHSLKRSAEASDRRKTSAFRSAMSMLTFYINRAGSGLGDEQRRVLEKAKDELRKDFGREPKG